MASDRLSPTQTAFLNNLFGVCNGNLKQAAKLTTGSDEYSGLLTDELTFAIKKRADTELALNVPKAVYIISKMLDDPEGAPFMDKLHKVAADILDRAGLSKQERAGNNMLTVGVVMLPSKAALPEPPTIENQVKQTGPTLLTQPINLNELSAKST